MLEELRKFIVEEYISKNKEIDADYFAGIIRIYCKYNKLNGYIKQIKFDSIDLIEDSEAIYIPEDNEITFDNELIDDHVDSVSKLLGNKLDEKEKNWFDYIYVARTIIHELVHVKQVRNRNSESVDNISATKDKILTGIDPYLKDNFYYSRKNVGKEEAMSNLDAWEEYLNNRYGYDILIERDAEIESSTIMNSIMEQYQDEVPHVKEFIEATLVTSIAMGYTYQNGRIVSPAYQYAKYLRSKNMIEPENCTWYDENVEKSTIQSIKSMPNTCKRLKYGLPLTPEEYLKFKRKLTEYQEAGYMVVLYGSEEKEENAGNR